MSKLITVDMNKLKYKKFSLLNSILKKNKNDIKV